MSPPTRARRRLLFRLRAPLAVTVAAIVVAASPGDSRGQPPAPAPAPRGDPPAGDRPSPEGGSGVRRGSPEALAAAAEHHRRGLIHYNLGEYDLAIREFRAGYGLSGAPGFLFNIAQAQRLAGRCADAARFYASYLRMAPSAAVRETARARHAEMLRCQGRRSVAAPPSRSDLEPARVAAAPRALERPPAWPGFALVGGGAALLATGGFFAWRAASAADEIEQLAADGGEWNDRHAATERRGRTAQILGVSAIAVGGAALVAGGVLLWRRARRDRAAHQAHPAAPRVTPQLSHRLAGLEVTWHF